MKRVLAAAAAAALLLVMAYLLLNRIDAAAGTAPSLAGAPAGDVRARGEYLARAADCFVCHTVAGSGRPYAGGVPFKLPFGTIYSTNITPDPTQGIGGWSDDEFVRAVRDGVGRHGEHLYPAFPYTSYTRLSRDDVLAIKAYLGSRRAIAQRNSTNDLHFPFDQRWAVGFWNALFFKDQRFETDASKPPAWNRGAYLATALGHCGECHTPRNLLFGVKRHEQFAGAELQGWRAYNITSDAADGIGGWSDELLAGYLKTGLAPGHAAANGPMGEAVEHSLQYLADDDVAALVVYLRSVPARGTARPPARAPRRAGSDTAASHSQGALLFAGACAGCHQSDGTGAVSPYAALAGTRGVRDPQGANVTQSILQGARLQIAGSDIFMPAFGGGYSNSDIAALANYVIAQYGGKEGLVTPDRVARRRAL